MFPDAEQLQSRAELYLCLAHAFLTPDRESAWDALRDALADDLADLGETLAYDFDEHVADYRAAIAAIPDHATLLQIYSALFLAPPRRVAINTGSYLDGAVNGGSVLMMDEAYRRGGLERSEDFKDLSDHVSIQLEFVASRYLKRLETAITGTDAEEFLGTFVAHWLPPFIDDLTREGAASEGTPNPWLPLARLLQIAVAQDARIAPETTSAAHQRQQIAIGKARHVRARDGIGDEDMAFIAQRLREKGLATDHLSIPPEQRDEARGLSKKVPPSPRRGSRLG
ncbi:MAG: molecular chaperone TorD family protein [Rhodocyclaceae bacterium]|nr:molecular chaperone TorD family protein [Rhodocyclaceae bacterium]